MAGEIVLHIFEELDLLREKCVLVLLCLTGDSEALFIRDSGVVFSMLFNPGELPPVNSPLFVRFPVEHIRIDAADGKPVVIDATSSLFQKPAGTGRIILCPQGIPGDIECPILVAEFRRRGWFQCSGINGFYRCYIAVEQEYMPVEFPGAALCAGCAVEFDLPDNTGETLHRVLKETVALLRQGSDT